MNREKAIKLFDELSGMCPGLILAGSTLRGKQDGIHDLDLILVCKIFPMHLLPVGEMGDSVKVDGSEILRFQYRGEQIDIYRTDKENLGAMLLHLTGPKEMGIWLRSKAKKMGYKLNQYGLYKGDKLVASKTEKEIFDALQVAWMEPSERNKFRSIKM